MAVAACAAQCGMPEEPGMVSSGTLSLGSPADRAQNSESLEILDMHASEGQFGTHALPERTASVFSLGTLTIPLLIASHFRYTWARHGGPVHGETTLAGCV
ncbi:MAG TPA: hypothetical protein VGZ22_02590, partial [Isosphaeraceae bacterium]|nr:hypothetical protein [Isosphaeraceae bacterium]